MARGSSCLLFWMQAAWLLLCSGLLPGIHGQTTATSTTRTASTTTSSAPARTSTAVLDASVTPVALNDSIIARSNLTLYSQTGAFFNFTIPASRFLNAEDATVTLWTSVSLCSGTAIQAYNTSNSTVLDLLKMSATEARQATLVSLYVSDDDRFQRPGPANASSLSSSNIGFALGGWTSVETKVKQQRTNSSESIWIGVWPPEDGRGVSSGTYEIQIVTSSFAKMESVDYTRRPRLDDTDNRGAIISSFNYTSPAPNLTAIVLPTFGENSLPDSEYFNSSFCAITDALSRTSIRVAQNDTKRGTLANARDDVRRQFSVSGLDAGTNYTFWLAETTLINNDPSLGLTTTLFPSIKMRTKTTDHCRLVSDVPFCPNVAYSIPLSPDISTEAGLATIGDFVDPIFSNFSAMIDTFPCGDPDFGMYSYVQTCETCKQSYRDWLCAVSMPRCTDPLDDPESQSRASQNGTDLTGAPTGLNIDLLPYIVNRNVNGSSASRQPYIDTLLQPGGYGELLPCIYTCYFVERTCPPMINWACPLWDITAQRDYGTFADSGVEGIGAAENGGAGKDGNRWGGYQRYVATDGFGNAYCNSMGVDFFLRESNTAVRSALLGASSLPLLIVTLLTVVTIFSS
ncbi:hypothetical protein BCV70DRAFT_201686 [Testicularia cyperi]|uniref:FZ domain-containing protein n=1 Tax=Testicularia cyperi TaxID=1882483 RepID=A0A317XKP4_9BASI|nr:hypothetical protein BCV70DRAFT_201686 [Testicularia cyperi]